ncbi:hypothetical protein AB0M22_15630 [Nocardia sp. NPDC051756]|uniref:hypothetical protein n=1 Tax=Nocardia sp. NPDC051756 TaxID=3154751 RepID=UPI0034122EC2
MAALLALAGCGQESTQNPAQPYSNDHTVQELCDFPKQFFLEHYDLSELVAKSARSKPIDSAIGDSAKCVYDNPSASIPNFGYALLSPETDSSKAVPAGARTRDLAIDGVTVTEIELPLDGSQDPNTADRVYILRATIDGWEGNISFKGGDQEARRAGAPVLVKMIQALKGSPISSTS